MKKQRKGKKPIKHERFRDRNFSSIEGHPRDGKTLKNPFSTLSNLMVPRSWVSECIPNILWACILATSFERGSYLELFRSVVSNAREKIERYAETFITHNYIQTLSDSEFDIIFADVLKNPTARDVLSALLVTNSLPDRSHWQRHLPPATDKHLDILAMAVGGCFDHQSEQSTDVRWLKLIYMVVIGKMVFGGKQADFLEHLRLFPNHGDMRSVRPMIRSAELAFRNLEFGEDESVSLPPPHQESFWAEMYSRTECIPVDDRKPPSNGPRATTIEIIELTETLSNHFHSTIQHTGIDARHDSAFGLVFYAMQILSEASATHFHSSAVGRSVLRTIVECYITLAYLVSKDDTKLWLKHRDYGNGQSKLSLLKNLRSDSIPRFIDLDLLEMIANEDKWIEFHDMHLGSWSETNLRTMATEAGLKDIYDVYYDICSGYTHGSWNAIRDSAFVICANPFHRFHRIPAPPKLCMRSILPDGIQLINLMLAELNKLYPGFSGALNEFLQENQPA